MFEETARIILNQRVTVDTWLLAMKSPRISKSAQPGQFVMIRVRSGMDPLLRRPFSICGTERDSFLVLYRAVGQGTAILTEAKGGEILSVLGPLGKGFELPASDAVPVLVGGGMGVAPLFFLAQRLKKRKTLFMMGFASEKDVLAIPQIKGTRTQVSIATEDGSKGHSGFVTDLLDDFLVKSGVGRKRHLLFTCGPKGMMSKMADISSSHGIPCQFSLEASMACGLGACLGCAIKAPESSGRAYVHVCKDGPVFRTGAIDWKAL
jgi:dihydroorotate dehydrogenase electron transfer subunit